MANQLFKRGSRFLRNGTYYFNSNGDKKVWYNKPKILPHSTDLITKVEWGEEWNPKAIANRVYGRYELGWVIMTANKLLHPRELIVGKQIRIPSLSRIIGIIV